MTARIELPAPVHALPSAAPAALLGMARRGLAEAAVTRLDGMRYATAHLAALRAAAAVLSARAVPAPAGRRARTPGVWVLLVQVAPELAVWADHFAAASPRRAAAEAGIPRVVTAGEADGMVRSATAFADVVAVVLGVDPAG